VIGFVALQLAFQRGGALATAGMSTLLNNALPIMAGIVAFHERLPAAPFGVVRAAGFVVVVLGAAMLARPERPALQALEDGSASTVASPGPPG
jgi:membrane-bound ClpP family serine protease